MDKKAEIINPLYFLIAFIIILVVFIISIAMANNIQTKACVKLGYDKYYQVGGKVGICVKDNGDFIDVKMVCENSKSYQVLLGQNKCKASKIKNG